MLNSSFFCCLQSQHRSGSQNQTNQINRLNRINRRKQMRRTRKQPKMSDFQRPRKEGHDSYSRGERSLYRRRSVAYIWERFIILKNRKKPNWIMSELDRWAKRRSVACSNWLIQIINQFRIKIS